MPRPRKKPEDKRSRKINVYMTEETYQEIKRRAEIVNIPLSELMVEAVLRRTPIEARRPQLDVQAINLLVKIGNNVNQAVRIASSSKPNLIGGSSLNPKAFHQLLGLLQELIHKLK